MQWSELVKRETVDSTYERMELILKQHEEFEKKGVLGDCELRTIAEEFAASVCEDSVVFYMDDIANAIAHYLAGKFLQLREELKSYNPDETSTNI